MNLIFKLIITLIFMNLLACTSPHKTLKELEEGTTKRQTLQKLGEPTEKYRKKGLDHWVYETLQKSKKTSGPRELLLYYHILIFEEGILIKKHYKRSFTTKEYSTFFNKN